MVRNDEFALWSEDFTDRMKRMCEEAELKRPAFNRKYREHRIDTFSALLFLAVAVAGCAYFFGWLLAQL